jgi:DNA-binding response OmpR family regulator
MSSKKVLLIEDDELDVALMRQIFSNFLPNVELFSVDTAHDGLVEIANGEYDLLILDMRLPDMDGIDMISQIDPTQAPNIIILSGMDDERLVSRARLLDVVAYLVKPINAEEFVSLVGSVLIDY